MGGLFSCYNSEQPDKLDSNKYSCYMTDFEKRIYPLIDHLKISKYHRSLIKKRFAKLVLSYEDLSSGTTYRYNSCRVAISIGSMILPTLQTIQDSENVASYKDYIYWFAIGTSLSVMISNNLISMFELDKKYIMYGVTTEKLKSLGWKYLESSDIFAGKTHQQNLTLFWNEVELIKKLQVLAEYASGDDKSSDTNYFDDELSDHNSDDDDSNSKKNIKHHDDLELKQKQMEINEIQNDYIHLKNKMQDELQTNIEDKINNITDNDDNIQIEIDTHVKNLKKEI